MHRPIGFRFGALAAVVLFYVATASIVTAAGQASGQRLTLDASSSEVVVVEGDLRAALSVAGPGSPVRLPLHPGMTVDLELSPFTITGPGTRFVLGRKHGPDVPLDFDPSRVALYRGEVAGHPGSHVFLALSESETTGYIDLGDSRPLYRISSRGGAGDELGPDRVSVFPATAPASLPPDVPTCGVSDHVVGAAAAAPPALLGGSPSTPGLKHMELAVETDYEFFQLFDDGDATAAYLVTLYAAMSDIFLRDVGTRVELVFARVWDQPDDLFNDVDPSPLSEFRNYWNSNMGAVARDVVQLLSGRRDYPFGGQAYLSSICGSNAYSVVGYAMGFFPDPSRPSPYHHDLYVGAHELGHNCGASHTHNVGIDSCANTSTSPQRGTIMSYCGQTWSGGRTNADLYFHAQIQQSMETFIGPLFCVPDDCNMNGVDDAIDLIVGSSDANSNNVPDECEDCNQNSTLDDADIVAGSSLDLNSNGIPDECEPDCDANNVPDDKQIADGTSTDAYGNNVPDECETDCNTNGVSDYTEIQTNMPLDVDRDAALDACQDCDGDLTTDLDQLQGAHSAWVASGQAGSPVREFLERTGVLTQTSSGTSVSEGQDLIATSTGRVLVTSATNDRVLEFDTTGAYVQDLVTAGSGGLDYPTGLVLHPDGRLLVASRNTNSVLAYDGTTGASLGAFVSAGSGGLLQPFGLTFGPGGNLFVTSGGNAILEYDGMTGASVGVFVASANNGGLDQARGLVFKSDGHLLVASYGTDEVLEFESGTGIPMGKWAQVGTPTNLTQTSPWGIRVGPNGNVFVVRTGDAFGSSASSSAKDEEEHDHEEENFLAKGAVLQLHLTNAQIYEFDIRNGNFIRTFIGGNDHGLLFPSGFDFVPGWSIDCNLNLLQDDCDIASGFSQDADSSGVPDECEIDCNANGTLDRLDVIPFGQSFDCNYNLNPDECDIASGISRDCDANGIPDECEVTEDFETAGGWTVGAPDDDANASGTWVRVDPNGTAAQPEDDHTPGSGTMCFVTGQGSPGGSDGAADVDGGKTTLFSPVFDLAADPDAEIGYWRWYSNTEGGSPGQDVFTIDVSDDGGANWTNVEIVGPGGPGNSGLWTYHQFRVADFVTATNTVQLRFVAADEGGGSVVEAAVDDLVILAACPCAADLDCNDGLSCTSDTCNLVTGLCDITLDADACVIDGSCYSDGELDPANPCQKCDPLVGKWVPAPAEEVTGLAVEIVAAATELSWTGQTAVVFDVAGGEVATMRSDGSVVGAACFVDDVSGTVWQDPAPDPALGDGNYYLVRSQKSCSSGTYGSNSSGATRLPAAACP